MGHYPENLSFLKLEFLGFFIKLDHGKLCLNCSAFTSSFFSGTSSAGVSFGTSASDILKVQTIACPLYIALLRRVAGHIKTIPSEFREISHSG